MLQINIYQNKLSVNTNWIRTSDSLPSLPSFVLSLIQDHRINITFEANENDLNDPHIMKKVKINNRKWGPKSTLYQNWCTWYKITSCPFWQLTKKTHFVKQDTVLVLFSQKWLILRDHWHIMETICVFDEKLYQKEEIFSWRSAYFW